MKALVTSGAGFIGSNLVEQTRDFVHVADEARANYLAGVSDFAAGSFNSGSGTRITIDELARVMNEATGAQANIVHVEPRPGDVRDSLVAIDAAREAFGFEPSEELAQGLRDYLDWLRQDPVTNARWEQ